MKLYKMSNNELSKEIKEFGKTVYGKITFILSYTIFIFLTLFLLGILISSVCFKMNLCSLFVSQLFVFADLLSFILGSIHFYNELRKYLNVKYR